MSNNFKALVLGASGLVGRHAVELLLQNDNYHTVFAVSRRGLDIEHAKLIQILADYDTIESKIADLSVDHFFSCIGTTKQKSPDSSEYYQIDHDYPVKVAEILEKKGCSIICIITAIGADENSRNSYLRMKGEVERDIQKVGFSNIHFFRPALIIGDRSDKRMAEDVAKKLFAVINPLLFGGWKKYRSIEGKKIASAMIQATKISDGQKVHKYTTDKIEILA